MKVLVVLLCLALTQVSAKNLDELTQEITELDQLLKSMEAAAARYIVIGKGNIRIVNEIMTKVDDRRRRCLILDHGSAPPVPRDPVEEVPLEPLTAGEEKSLSQLTDEITSLDSIITKTEGAVQRYVGIGKANIGLLARVAEAGRRHVCEDDYHIRCAMGFQYNAVTNACYREVIGRFKTFEDAQATCHRRGGHLPRPRNQDENDMLPTLLQLGLTRLDDSENLHALWIGVRKNEGVWRYVHPEDEPENLEWSHFASEEEEEGKDCAYLCTMSNKWIKRPCSDTVRVICERAANPAPAVDED